MRSALTAVAVLGLGMGLLPSAAAATPTQGTTRSAETVAKKKASKGRLKVKLTGTGSYTVSRKKYRKTAATSKTFRVKPGRYRITAPGATVQPAKVRVRKGRTAKVQVSFPSPNPTPPPTPTPPPPPPKPKLNPNTLASGGFHSCALDTTGKAWCWGFDLDGQIGDGNDGQASEYSPVAVAGGRSFTFLTAGTSHTCGLDTEGKAWCWGNDLSGQGGDGNDGQADEYAPVAVDGGHTFKHLTAGAGHTCGIDMAGKAWCWGFDFYGGLGDGDDGQGAEFSPVAVAGGLTFSHLRAGALHTCGIDTAGAAWCWGRDFAGQVGDGNDGQADQYAPAAVASGRTFTHLAAGLSHTCGLDTTGQAWCWGSDAFAQIGDGDDGQANEYAPVAVAGGRTFTHLAGNGNHGCGIDTAGAAWCWGYDFNGEVGDGDDGQGNQFAPAPVAGGRAFATIAAGEAHTCGIDTAGAAWCWGTDQYGRLGDGNDDQASEFAPVVVAGGHTFATTF
jgi:alpha-tubulin suppressor-like RCC1 family protein